jgi:putative lipoprotein
MRRIVFMLTALTVLAVSACSQSSSQQAAVEKTPGPITSVTGTVTLSAPRALSSKARMEISLVDASTQSGAPLASKVIEPVNKMPVNFSLDFAPAKINRGDLYVVHATMTDGERQFSMPLQAPVLTKGASNHVNITLVAQATAGEKMLAAFKKVQTDIGGMKMSHGTSLAKDVSRGWQTFRDKQTGDVLFVRELADYGKKGFTSTDYAYKNGKPWVVVQKKKPSQHAPATEIDRVGWDAAGKLVIKDKALGHANSTLSDADAAALLQQAAAMYAKVSKEGNGKSHK